MPNKPNYYRLLKEVTEKNNWTEWIEFVLQGIEETSKMTLNKINHILQLKDTIDQEIRNVLKSSYKKEISDLLFSYPYIKIKILEEKGIAKRQSASVYLQKLATAGILRPLKIGKEIYYINVSLMKILSN